MQINIKQLRQLIKKTITETYLGMSSTFGGLDSPAYNKAGSMQKKDPNISVDEVELTQKMLSILCSIELPQSGDSYSDTSVSESDIAVAIRAHIGGDAGFPVGDFGDKAFNHAAAEAARVLIDSPEDLKTAAKMCARGLLSPDAEYDRAVTRLYEEIIAFPRNLK